MKADIKNNSKFVERVNELNLRKSRCKVIINPPLFTVATIELIVAAIGVNGSFLVVRASSPIDVFWTVKTSTAYHVNDVSRKMASWLIESDDTDYEEVLYRELDVGMVAIKAVAAVRGESVFANEPLIHYTMQGVLQKPVPNPYRKQ